MVPYLSGWFEVQVETHMEHCMEFCDCKLDTNTRATVRSIKEYKVRLTKAAG